MFVFSYMRYKNFTNTVKSIEIATFKSGMLLLQQCYLKIVRQKFFWQRDFPCAHVELCKASGPGPASTVPTSTFLPTKGMMPVYCLWQQQGKNGCGNRDVLSVPPSSLLSKYHNSFNFKLSHFAPKARDQINSI